MKSMLILAAIMLLPFFKPADALTGRWETMPSEKGTVTGIVFKPDNSFEGYVNRKPFVTGNYNLTDSIFSFVDNGCDGMRGNYKIIFFSNADSVRFEAISDSCAGRKAGMARLIFGRVKSKQ